MEHHISSETLGRLVALFQFMHTYGHHEHLSKFLQDGATVPCGHCPNLEEDLILLSNLRPLTELEPGTSAQISWIDGDAEQRLNLVEKGLLPNVRVSMEAHHGGHARVRIKGSPVRLTEEQASAVRIKFEENPEEI